MVPLLKNLHLHLPTTALEFYCCLWILLQGFPVLPPLTFLLREGSHNSSDFPHHDTGKYRCNEHLSFQVLLPDRYKEFRASYEQMQRAFWLTLSNSFFISKSGYDTWLVMVAPEQGIPSICFLHALLPFLEQFLECHAVRLHE